MNEYERADLDKWITHGDNHGGTGRKTRQGSTRPIINYTPRFLRDTILAELPTQGKTQRLPATDAELERRIKKAKSRAVLVDAQDWENAVTHVKTLLRKNQIAVATEYALKIRSDFLEADPPNADDFFLVRWNAEAKYFDKDDARLRDDTLTIFYAAIVYETQADY